MWHWLSDITTNYTWIVQAAIVLIGTVFLIFVERLVYKRIVHHFEKTRRLWDDLLLHTLHPPLIFLILLLGTTYAAEIVKLGVRTLPIQEPTIIFRRLGIILFLLWFLVRLIRQTGARLLHPAYRKRPLDQTTVDAIVKLLVSLVAIVSAISILKVFNIGVAVLLTFFGGGALIVGFGAKDILANFFGAWMIYLDRPFSVGDWISSPDKNIEGTVEHIGWRLTRIRTFDKRPLFVPNSMFSSISVQNNSRMMNRRIKTNIGLRYCDGPKVAAIVADIDEMLKNHPDIELRQTCFVRLNEFGDSSLNLLVYCFTKTTEWLKYQTVQEDVFLKIIDIVYNQHKASLAFPTRTLETSDSLVAMMKGSNHD